MIDMSTVVGEGAEDFWEAGSFTYEFSTFNCPTVQIS